ncbi:hypothetical protein [Leucothrix pacifica]|uniref:Uncharacterized protein n=1 Tax=Leucothrix pacifica TaxID=1247513 RepID=A0A317CAP9_9GAMM|nr:hypothetical protein [Leucothrix pacifica]PWQ95447.1 hypothetical protein DKW60_15340 [Leucothrix pacifica]
MSAAQTSIQETAAKFKTTLYLTEENKKRLDLLNAKNRTRLINQAIAEKLEAIERQLLKEKLLSALDAPVSHPSNGVSTEDALHEIRQRETEQLLTGSKSE